ncbi:MAG: hypothetical protein ABIH82_05245 [Candidatus Woesearchaeota archaeon]
MTATQAAYKDFREDLTEEQKTQHYQHNRMDVVSMDDFLEAEETFNPQRKKYKHLTNTKMNDLELELEEVAVTTKVTETQTCKRCGEDKSLHEFRSTGFGIHKTCKICVDEQHSKTLIARRRKQEIMERHKERSLFDEVAEVTKLAEQTSTLKTSTSVSPVDVRASVVSAVLPIIVDNNYEFTFEVPALGISINTLKKEN